MLSENDHLFRCSLRGKLKNQLALKRDKLLTLDYAILGDFVNFSESSQNIGVIESLEPRKNYISRKAGRLRGSLKRGERYEQIIASNIDSLYIVTSCKSPKFNNKFLDRVIVSAESSQITPVIVINKIDLDDNNISDYWEQFYKSIGYKVFKVSSLSGNNINKLKKDIRKKLSLFWGQSGVGKSSLLNKMFPHLDFNVGEISESSNKGTHTTVTSVLTEAEKDTFIIDTPGIREIDPYGIKKEDLSHYYIEFIPYINNCKFNTCIHDHEPGCAIQAAVENKLISVERYESYINLLNTIEDDMIY